MSVYVDDMQATFGRMRMCHMIADTRAELLEMADRIGVDRRWLQAPGDPAEHFDVCLSKRAAALKAGAIEISSRQVGQMIRNRRLASGGRL